MTRRLRRVRTIATLTASILTCLGVGVGSALASDLFLPRESADALIAEIDRQCPECRANGLSPCGGPDIQVGKRYAKHVFQGKPKRGYLLTFIMTHGAFFDALRTPDRDAFIATMTTRFKAARLIAIDAGFAKTRVLPPPASVTVQYTPAHHQCFGIDQRSPSCCLGDGGGDRTCLPKADSPRVHFTFDDLENSETLQVVWAPIAGFSKLVRKPGDGRETLYYCLTNDAGTLKGR